MGQEDSSLGVKNQVLTDPMLGRIHRALGSRLTTETGDAVMELDAKYANCDGSLAKFAGESNLSPLAAARAAFDLGHINADDDRFRCAFEVELEARDSQFADKMCDRDTMVSDAKKFGRDLRNADSGGLLTMRAISSAITGDEPPSARTMAIALEKAAMSKNTPQHVRDEMLMQSARYTQAEQMVRNRVVQSEKSSKPRDEAR